MSSKKRVVAIGFVLVIIGVVMMYLMKDKENGHLISGLVVGAGGGLLSALVATKNKKKNS